MGDKWINYVRTYSEWGFLESENPEFDSFLEELESSRVLLGCENHFFKPEDRRDYICGDCTPGSKYCQMCPLRKEVNVKVARGIVIMAASQRIKGELLTSSDQRDSRNFDELQEPRYSSPSSSVLQFSHMTPLRLQAR